MYIHRGLGLLLEERVFSWRVCSVFCCVDQVGALTEGFTTHFTHMRLFSWTNWKINCQMRSNENACTQYMVNEMRYTLLLTHQLFCKGLIIDNSPPPPPPISSIQMIPFYSKFQISLSLTSVYEGVFLHVGFLVESLATVLAGIWPRVRVDQEVGGQSGWAFEYLATFLALKCSFLKFKMNKCNDNLQITL